MLTILLMALLMRQLPWLPVLPPGVIVVPALLMALVLLTLGWRRHLSANTVAWLASLLAGLVLVLWPALGALSNRLPPELEGQDLAVVGQVRGVVTRFEHGRGFSFFIDRCVLAVKPCPAKRKVRLSWYGRLPRGVTQIKAGQRWRLNIRLKRPHSLVNPGGFDGELGAMRRGIAGVGYVRSKRRQESAATYVQVALLPGRTMVPAAFFGSARDAVHRAMRELLTRVGPSDAGSVGTVIALVTGHQAAIPPVAWSVYNRTGTAHLMSISGLHVTMFAALAIVVLRGVLRLPVVPVDLLRRMPAQHLAWLLGLFAALAYSAFSGWGVPAQRTCWMLAAAGAIAFSGRRCPVWFAMAGAGAVVVAADPWAPLTAGFWLSFVAVCAILLVATQAPGRTGRSKLLIIFREALRTQWAASISLIPITAFWFGAVSLVGPVANAVAIPVVSWLITPLAMVGGLLAVFWPAAAQWFVSAAAWLAHGLLWLLSAMAGWPWATWITGQPGLLAQVVALLGALTLLLPLSMSMRLPAALVMLSVLLWPADKPGHADFRVLALDVGQGSSVLIQTASRSLLFDTGPVYSGDYGAGLRVVTPVLRQQRVSRLDMLMISHADADHTGSARHVASQFRASRVLGSSQGRPRDTRHLPAMQPCRRGQSWSWDGVQFNVLHPGVQRAVRRTRNATSCVLMVSSPAGSVLLTGDIERKQERELVSIYGNAGLASDVVVVPHHGSNTSSSAAFIDAVSPRWAVIQAGYRNRFRHPAALVTERYRERNVRLLRSDADGAVAIEFRAGQAPRLTRYRDKHRRYWRIPVAR